MKKNEYCVTVTIDLKQNFNQVRARAISNQKLRTNRNIRSDGVLFTHRQTHKQTERQTDTHTHTHTHTHTDKLR